MEIIPADRKGIMEFLQNAISEPFTWGLLIGLALFLWSCLGHLKARRQHKGYRRMLEQKMELEASSQEQIRKEVEELKKTNENLRFKVNQLKDKPGQSQQQDLEIMARAERQLMVSAPGFAGAWEQAKMKAREEIESEEEGKIRPRRIFRQLMGGSRKQVSGGDSDETDDEESASERGRGSTFAKDQS